MLRTRWTFNTCPVQKSVRIKSVVDAVAFANAKLKAQGSTSLSNGFAGLLQFCERRSVFMTQVLIDLLAFRWHVWIEFKRLKVDIGLNLALQPLQCDLQRPQADHTPRARHV